MRLKDCELHDFKFGHVLYIDAAYGDALIVDNNKVINIVGFIELEDFDGKHIGGEGDGVGCHDGVDGFFEKIWGF